MGNTDISTADAARTRCGAVGLWGCGAVGLWGCGAVGLWGCEAVGLRGCEAVGLRGCEAVGCGARAPFSLPVQITCSCLQFDRGVGMRIERRAQIDDQVAGRVAHDTRIRGNNERGRGVLHDHGAMQHLASRHGIAG